MTTTMTITGRSGATTTNPPVVTVYADPICDWALLVLHRLRAARDRYRPDVVFDQRAWPLEWVNGHPPPPPSYHRGVATVLATLEPGLFADVAEVAAIPTVLPAFDLIAAARRTHGPRAGEDLTYHLGRAYLCQGADITSPRVLHQVARDAGLDADAVLRTWAHEPVRDDVTADYQRSHQLPIQGSPQIFWPDGTSTHNPGLTDHHREAGRLVIGHTDPTEPARQLLAHTGAEHPVPLPLSDSPSRQSHRSPRGC